MRKIDVINYNDESANDDFRYKGTFLHGELETEIGYDIFCFTEPSYFTYGATEVIIKRTNKVATFFLWRGDKFNQYRGYLVYNDDKEFKQCKMNFENDIKHI
jgi:hypothetical protein